MFQSDNLFSHLSVRQSNVINNKISEDIENHLHFLRIFLSLIENAMNYLYELQRVALIKTLSREKPIILLDEPFSALDGDMIKASILIQEHTKKQNQLRS